MITGYQKENRQYLTMPPVPEAGFHVSNFWDNDDVEVLENGGPFSVLAYMRDLSVLPQEAAMKYYMSEMNCLKKQLVCRLNGSGVILQAGAMQWMAGKIQQTSGIKGAGDLLKKSVVGKATGEGAVKPEYVGTGVVVTEPTYLHYLLEDLSDWGGSVVLQDGLFCAAENAIKTSVVTRNRISGLAAGEGLFNLCLSGKGYFAVECRVPREELIVVDLNNGEIRIDGSYAVMWSKDLTLTVERSGKTLLGSAVSGEGLVNVYRGTGRVVMMPQV